MIRLALVVMTVLLMLWAGNAFFGYAGIFGKGLREGAKAFFGHLLRRP
jgi:hypothetical protein